MVGALRFFDLVLAANDAMPSARSNEKLIIRGYTGDYLV